MITNLNELNHYLEKLFQYPAGNVAKIDPHMANGLMVRGKEEISKIGFGVSASIELFKKAKEEKCDVVVTHHSFNIPSLNTYDPIFQNRIQYLIENDISLFGYHFLLDWHPEIGNNVQILKIIGANPTEPYLFYENPWGWAGELEAEKDIEDIKKLLNPLLSPRTLVYAFGPQKIKKIVVISGKGAPHADEMKELIDRKIDLYITGEAHEWNRELFREAKINFIAGGHYHSEVFGVKALMERIKKEMTLDTVWLDLINEV